MLINSKSETLRLLSVSGGGLLGVIPVAFLERYETLGRQTYGDDYRLCHSFDAVGGASTGAVIATAVALGASANDIVDIYIKDAVQFFGKPRRHLPFLSARFDGQKLHDCYEGWTGPKRMDRACLMSDLSILLKDADGARPVLLTTSKLEVGNAFGVDVINKPLSIAQVLQAATAAPGLFDPVLLPLGDDEEMKTCIDGALGPFSNPSLALWRANQSRSGNVQMLSLGTGASPAERTAGSLKACPSALLALKAFKQSIRDGVEQVKCAMEAFSALDGALSFQHLDIPLDASTLRQLGLRADRKHLRQMRDFANPAGKVELYHLARKFAKEQISRPLELREDAATDLCNVLDLQSRIAATRHSLDREAG